MSSARKAKVMVVWFFKFSSLTPHIPFLRRFFSFSLTVASYITFSIKQLPFKGNLALSLHLDVIFW